MMYSHSLLDEAHDTEQLVACRCGRCGKRVWKLGDFCPKCPKPKPTK